MNQSSIRLARFGFYFTLALFFYGTLFPFQFSFSPHSLSEAWSRAGLTAYWDGSRGRIGSLPDMMSNILLAVPLGFFGFLSFDQEKKIRSAARWGAAGLVLGLSAEILQLGIPSRTASLTDALNNGLGAFLGACVASLVGRRFFELLSGELLDRRNTYLWILAGIVSAMMLAPFDFTLDVSHLRSSLKTFLADPWAGGAPVEDAWVEMAEFALLGALAGAIARKGEFPFQMQRSRAAAAVLLLPPVLEFSQLFVESHMPGLRDLTMELLGAGAGLVAGMRLPNFVRPLFGFALMVLSLTAASLSPYRFTNRPWRASFEWIPLREYYIRTTASALYDAMTGMLTFALLGGLLKLASGFPRWLVVAIAASMAALLELAQIYLPGRYAGTTDILIAALGAWVGDTVCTSIELRVTACDPSDSLNTLSPGDEPQ